MFHSSLQIGGRILEFHGLSITYSSERERELVSLFGRDVRSTTS